MITIELNLFATIAKYLPGDKQRCQVNENTSVDELIQELGIPDDLVKLIFINGKRVQRTHRLKQGDRLGIFPPVGGG
jgi:sulfur-carrier protein